MKIKMKKCFRCKIKKDLNGFHRNKNQALGREYICKECVRKKDKNPVRAKQKAEAAWRSKLKYKNKVKVRKKTDWLIESGKIIKKPCEICGEKKSEVHHPDYSKPEKVKFLCRQHHTDLHRKGLTIEQMKELYASH